MAGNPIVSIVRDGSETMADLKQSLLTLEKALQEANSDLLLIDGRKTDLSCTTLIDIDELAVDFLRKVTSCRRLAIICPSLPAKLAHHYQNLFTYNSRNACYFDDLNKATEWLRS